MAYHKHVEHLNKLDELIEALIQNPEVSVTAKDLVGDMRVVRDCLAKDAEEAEKYINDLKSDLEDANYKNRKCIEYCRIQKKLRKSGEK